MCLELGFFNIFVVFFYYRVEKWTAIFCVLFFENSNTKMHTNITNHESALQNEQ